MKPIAILSSTGKFKRNNGLEVEKTPDAIFAAFQDLVKKGKISLLEGGLPRGELKDFQLAIVASGDNLPLGKKLSINYEGFGTEQGNKQTQDCIDIDSAYITNNPLNDFAQILHDNKDGAENTSEVDTLKKELESLKKEKETFVKEQGEFVKIREEHKAMKADVEAKLDAEVKVLTPEKPPQELTEALAGIEDKKLKLRILKAFSMANPAVKVGAIVPVPDNSHEGNKGKPFPKIKYGGVEF